MLVEGGVHARDERFQLCDERPSPVRCQARGVELPEAQRRTPLLHQVASDGCAGPCDDIVAPSEAMGIDFGAGLAVVTGDVLRGSTPAQALDGVRLVMLANTVALPRSPICA